eukprot:scaffold202_cov180-Amphora_coffeaeformis.AAC.4
MTEESSNTAAIIITPSAKKLKPTNPHPRRPRPPRKPGEPYVHPLILGGTLSLGILLLIGSGAIAIVSNISRADFKDAELNDFQYLGESACHIESAVNYRTIEEELNALNTNCLEQWEYQVRVETDEIVNDVFVTDWLSFKACSTSCYLCPDSRRYGENYYAGVDILRRGEYITNETAVECWGPTKAVESLSSFYNCGPQKTTDAPTCYLLADPRDKLKDSIDSYEMGMLGAYTGFGGGAVLLLVAGWCVWKNKRVRAQDQKILRKQATTSTTVGGDEHDSQA